MEHLIETLEAITDDIAWGLACEWSRDYLQNKLGQVMAQVRCALEEAKDLALVVEMKGEKD